MAEENLREDGRGRPSRPDWWYDSRLDGIYISGRNVYLNESFVASLGIKAGSELFVRTERDNNRVLFRMPQDGEPGIGYSVLKKTASAKYHRVSCGEKLRAAFPWIRDRHHYRVHVQEGCATIVLEKS